MQGRGARLKAALSQVATEVSEVSHGAIWLVDSNIHYKKLYPKKSIGQES
jgi:hypothetical protein